MGLTKYFKQKYIDAKFSRLGKGSVLNAEKVGSSSFSSDTSIPPRVSPSADAARAAEAALSRASAKPSSHKSASSYQVQAERADAINKLKEAEALANRIALKVTIDSSAAGKRVSFWCPNILGESFTGSYKETEAAIESYLLSEMTTSPFEAATLLLIRGIESSPLPPGVDQVEDSEISIEEIREKRRQNFVKIIKNLIDHPENEVYRRLRVSNKFIADLLAIKGAAEFLNACGFVREKITAKSDKSEPNVGGTIEDGEFLVLSASTSEQMDHLNEMLLLLETAEPILPELYRDTTIFRATGSTSRALNKEELPADFFTVTLDDFRRIMDQQQKAIEEGGMLLTKALRERLKTRERRLYRFVLIRVRLPQELILQGVFRASENLTDVRLWINSCFENEAVSYKLWAPPGVAPTGRPLTGRVALEDPSSSLVDLGLAPCSLLTLSSDDSLTEYNLRPELLQRLQTL